MGSPRIRHSDWAQPILLAPRLSLMLLPLLSKPFLLLLTKQFFLQGSIQTLILFQNSYFAFPLQSLKIFSFSLILYLKLVPQSSNLYFVCFHVDFMFPGVRDHVLYFFVHVPNIAVILWLLLVWEEELKSNFRSFQMRAPSFWSHLCIWTTSIFLPWESHEQYEKTKRVDTERWTSQDGRCPICYWRSVEK